MSEIKVGEYVRTDEGIIEECTAYDKENKKCRKLG